MTIHVLSNCKRCLHASPVGKRGATGGKRSAPKLLDVFVGSHNTAPLTQWKLTSIVINSQHSGTVKLTVLKGKHVVAKRTAKLDLNTTFVPLSKLLHGRKLAKGRYTLRVSFRGQTTTVHFRVV